MRLEATRCRLQSFRKMILDDGTLSYIHVIGYRFYFVRLFFYCTVVPQTIKIIRFFFYLDLYFIQPHFNFSVQKVVKMNSHSSQ